MNRPPDGAEHFERGDVVWGIDPFRTTAGSGDHALDSDSLPKPRPWLVLSDASTPFHPALYLCLTLSSRTWHDDSIPIDDDHWLRGGTPVSSAILPWSVVAIRHDHLDTTGELVARLHSLDEPDSRPDGYQGRLSPTLVDAATRQLRAYLTATLET